MFIKLIQDIKVNKPVDSYEKMVETQIKMPEVFKNLNHKELKEF